MLVQPNFVGPIEPRRHPRGFEKCGKGLRFLNAGFCRAQVFATSFFPLIVFLLITRN
jgi:hypothetical protein